MTIRLPEGKLKELEEAFLPEEPLKHLKLGEVRFLPEEVLLKPEETPEEPYERREMKTLKWFFLVLTGLLFFLSSTTAEELILIEASGKITSLHQGNGVSLSGIVQNRPKSFCCKGYQYFQFRTDYGQEVTVFYVGGSGKEAVNINFPFRELSKSKRILINGVYWEKKVPDRSRRNKVIRNSVEAFSINEPKPKATITRPSQAEINRLRREFELYKQQERYRRQRERYYFTPPIIPSNLPVDYP